MHKFRLITLIFILGLAIAQLQAQVQVPSSKRATAAVKKHSERLTKEFASKSLSLGSPIFMRIIKDKSDLELWVQKGDNFKLFKTYKICYYSGEPGPKKQLGDGQSPEGFYYVRAGQMNPWSNFHLSFNMGYPNIYDRAHGYTGNYLMVHGDCVSIGCYAMTDEVIEEIWTIMNKAFNGGQPFFRIHSFPFHMTSSNLAKHKSSPHYAFWKNLKTGYDLFETNKTPPNVEVVNKEYVFDAI